MSRPITHKTRFAAMKDETAILRNEQYAKWTIAHLMVDLEKAAHSRTQLAVERDYQEMGALLVNNLSAKLAGLLFPTSRPFFKIGLSPELQDQAEGAGVTATAVAAELARMEMDACQQLFKNASYNQLVQALRLLIITGNCLMYRDSKTKRSIVYSMQQFTLRRDTQGNLLDCVLREFTYFEALAPNIQKQLLLRYPSKYNQPHTTEPTRVELYTRIHREQTKAGKIKFIVSQEADEIPVGKQGSYPEHLCPWQAPVWNLIAGEHYGRGLVEDYAGGFAKLSDLSEAAALYEVESARVLNLVSSGSGTDIDTMATAAMGQWVTGDPGTVASYEAGSHEKVRQMRESIAEVFGRLARAFMYTANTRDAERVTAYELQRDAREAENTLGGTYSSLAESIQVPLAHILLTEIRPGTLEGLVTDDIRLDIMAGIPALGRSSEAQNVLMVTQEAAVAIQLAQVDQRIDVEKLMDLLYSGQSVDTTALFKSDDQLRAEADARAQEAQGQQQLAMAAGLAETQQAVQQLTQ